MNLRKDWVAAFVLEGEESCQYKTVGSPLAFNGYSSGQQIQ
jgi:hypothetical protein